MATLTVTARGQVTFRREVLRRVYRLAASDISEAIESLLAAENVVTDRAAAEAGLAVLRAGGDFADGLIAHQGRWLGGEDFVSFDRQAVDQLRRAGQRAQVVA